MKGKYAAKAGIIRIEDAGPQCRGLAPIAIGKRVQPGGSSLSAFSAIARGVTSRPVMTAPAVTVASAGSVLRPVEIGLRALMD